MELRFEVREGNRAELYQLDCFTRQTSLSELKFAMFLVLNCDLEDIADVLGIDTTNDQEDVFDQYSCHEILTDDDFLEYMDEDYSLTSADEIQQKAEKVLDDPRLLGARVDKQILKSFNQKNNEDIIERDPNYYLKDFLSPEEQVEYLDYVYRQFTPEKLPQDFKECFNRSEQQEFCDIALKINHNLEGILKIFKRDPSSGMHQFVGDVIYASNKKHQLPGGVISSLRYFIANYLQHCLKKYPDDDYIKGLYDKFQKCELTNEPEDVLQED